MTEETLANIQLQMDTFKAICKRHAEGLSEIVKTTKEKEVLDVCKRISDDVLFLCKDMT